MDWCIRQGVDGVVTDDIPKFVEMCEGFDEGRRYAWSLAMIRGFLFFNFWVFLFTTVWLRRYGVCVVKRIGADKDK